MNMDNVPNEMKNLLKNDLIIVSTPLRADFPNSL